MRVLSWNQQRKKLLRQLAGLDAAVARRVVQVEATWADIEQEIAAAAPPTAKPTAPPVPLAELASIQEYSTAEDVLSQPKPPLTDGFPPEPDEAPQAGEIQPAAVPTNTKSLASYLD